MTTFTVTVTSTASVAADRSRAWAALTDPDVLVRLTPMLTRIDADGDTWVWHMTTVRGLGKSLTPVFTEAMTFDEPSSIRFEHAPPPGAHERIGVGGRYDLTEITDGVRLAVSLTITAELPLPRAAALGVTQVMRRTATMMGDRFSEGFLREVQATR